MLCAWRDRPALGVLDRVAACAAFGFQGLYSRYPSSVKNKVYRSIWPLRCRGLQMNGGVVDVNGSGAGWVWDSSMFSVSEARPTSPYDVTRFDNLDIVGGGEIAWIKGEEMGCTVDQHHSEKPDVSIEKIFRHQS